jgi:hypothetical protein
VGQSAVESVRTVSNATAGGKPKPVYNLKVAEGHLPEFFANGVLVHNCQWTQDSGESPDRMDALVWGLTEVLENSSALAFLNQIKDKKAVQPSNGLAALGYTR